PHSIGIFYTAATQYLGFPFYGDEYKVMGLSPYGSPRFKEPLGNALRSDQGRYRLQLDWFAHHERGASESWAEGDPTFGSVYSDRWVREFGPARRPEDNIEQRHMDLAASVQSVCEEAVLGLLRHVQKSTSARRLCLAGGVAFNSVANGK